MDGFEGKRPASVAIEPKMIESISAMIGAAIAGLIGWGSSRWLRARDGRDRFLSILSEIEAELDTAQPFSGEAARVHTASLPDLRAAVYAVQTYIPRASFLRLREIWRRYQAHDANSKRILEDHLAHDIARAPLGSPMNDVEQIRQFLLQFRDEID